MESGSYMFFLYMICFFHKTFKMLINFSEILQQTPIQQRDGGPDIKE